jgi:hypothetical protein
MGAACSKKGSNVMQSVAVRLKESIEEYAEALSSSSALQAIAQRGELRPRAFAQYLESLRQLFQESQRSLALAAERSEQLGDAPLAEYFWRKVGEEHGHDEWASDDLAQLPAAASFEVSPARSIGRLIALQRELIAVHPICFVAYSLWAEYFTVLLGDDWLAALAANGYERGQVSAVAKHVDADRAHAAHGFAVMDRLWRGQPDQATVLRGVERAGAIFRAFCDEICCTSNASRPASVPQPA